MAVFMLDCDSVTSGASSIGNLATQVSQVGDSVSGYDTSCEDGFDFASAKSAMASNVEACVTKIKNTQSLVEGVVSSHTALQSSLSMNGDANQAADTNGSTTSADGTNTSGSGYTGGGYSGGGYSGGGYSGGGYSGGGSYSAGVATGVVSEIVSELQEAELERVEEVVDVTNKIDKVDQVTINLDELDDKLKSDYIKKLEYNEQGYGMVGDRYVVVCDKTVGAVGDEIVITDKEGNEVKCIVGINLDGQAGENTKTNISFIVNDKWDGNNENNPKIDLSNSKVTNTGPEGKYASKQLDSSTSTDSSNSNTSTTTDSNNSNSSTTDSNNSNTSTTTDNNNSSTGSTEQNSDVTAPVDNNTDTNTSDTTTDTSITDTSTSDTTTDTSTTDTNADTSSDSSTESTEAAG